MTELDRILGEPLEEVLERERIAFDRELAQSGGRVVLFGAGSLGRKVLDCLRSIGVEPLAFADNRKGVDRRQLAERRIFEETNRGEKERRTGDRRKGDRRKKERSRLGVDIAAESNLPSAENVETLHPQVMGVPILSPGDAAEEYGQSTLFIVTIWSLGHSYLETRAKLEQLGCTRVTSTATLRWKFAHRMLPDFCQDLPHKLYEQKTDVRRMAELWADELSRREYLNHVRWRALGDLGALGKPVEEESYFLDSLYRIEDGEVFVDCGAYTGDTAEQVVKRNPRFGKIVAIEADPKNFQHLKNWMGTLNAEVSSKIEALKIAVGAERGELRFQASGDEGAKLTVDGDVVVECVPLDELLGDGVGTSAAKAGSEKAVDRSAEALRHPKASVHGDFGHPPTFIKMDIEGAELDALAGARRVIQKHRPILSICVYHKQDDLWRIPLFIHSLAEDYKLYLRPHDVDGWQLVCYAVPEHRLQKSEVRSQIVEVIGS